MVGMPCASRSIRTSRDTPLTFSAPSVTGSARQRYSANAAASSSTNASSATPRRRIHFMSEPSGRERSSGQSAGAARLWSPDLERVSGLFHGFAGA